MALIVGGTAVDATATEINNALDGMAQGDIVYASAADTPAQLTKGTDDYVLTMNGNVPNWEAAGGASFDTAITINDSGADADFRVEASGEANALFVQGSDGFVGIGTATPPTLLTLDTSSTGNFIEFNIDGGDRGWIGVTAGNDLYIGSGDNSYPIVLENAVDGEIYLNGSSSGNVGIGTTSPEETLHIEGQCFAKSSSTAVKAYRTTPTTTSTVFRVYSDVTSAETKHADIACDGDMLNTNGSYGQYSDVSLKQDISDATSQWDDVKLLASKARKFRLKAEVNALGDEAKWMLGFVAQEIEDISPYLVKDLEDEDTGETIKAVKYSIAQMKAFKALGEALDRVEQLEAKVEALENE